MNKTDFIRSQVEDWDDDKLRSVWNERCQECRCYDDVIEVNDDDFLNNMFSSPDEAVRACYYGEYRYNDNYVHIGGDGNLYSFDYVDCEDSPFDMDELVEYIESNISNYYTDFDEDEARDAFIEEFITEPDEFLTWLDDSEDGPYLDFITDEWSDILDAWNGRNAE